MADRTIPDDGERVTTGSEPRRWRVKHLFNVDGGFKARVEGPRLRQGALIEVQEVVCDCEARLVALSAEMDKWRELAALNADAATQINDTLLAELAELANQRDIAEVVAPDHDERAEGWLTETHAAAFSEGHKAGVKAVVEALRERAAEQSDSRAPAYPAQFYRVTARWLAERFNLTESGGDDDDKQLP